MILFFSKYIYMYTTADISSVGIEEIFWSQLVQGKYCIGVLYTNKNL